MRKHSIWPDPTKLGVRARQPKTDEVTYLRGELTKVMFAATLGSEPYEIARRALARKVER